MKPFGSGQPWQMSLEDLQREMNQFFDKLWHAGVRTGPLDGQDWSPAIDVFEEADRFVVKAEVPGCSVSDIEVTLSGQELTLRGEKRAEEEPAGKGRRLRSERRFGKFLRTVELPCAVQEDEVLAAVRNGVLRVVLQKKEEARPKSVRLRVEDEEPGAGTA